MIECFRAMHSHDGSAVCLLFESSEKLGRLRCYREHFAENVGPAQFALQVYRQEQDKDAPSGWCEARMWEDGGPALVWRANRVYCRKLSLPENSGWALLKDFLAPVSVQGRQGREMTARLQWDPECGHVNTSMTALAWDGDEPQGDLLVARCMLIACASRKAVFTVPVDPEQEGLLADEREMEERKRKREERESVGGRSRSRGWG